MAPLFGIRIGVDPAAWEEYTAERLYELDLWLSKAWQVEPGSVVTGSELVSRETFDSSVWKNEFLDRWNLHDLISSIPVVSPSLFASVSFYRPASVDLFSGEDKSTLAALSPHINQAVIGHIKLTELHGKLAAIDAVLDRLDFGLIVLNDRKEIVAMNRAAKAQFEACDGLFIDRRQANALSRQDNKRLQLCIAKVLQGQGEAASAGIVAIGRPSMKRPYSIQVLPVSGAAAVLNYRLALRSGSVVLIVSDPEANAPPPIDALAKLYGLTPREAQLAAMLATGTRLSTVAEHCSITIGTARNHLKSILQKTGCGRQVELVKLLQAHVLLNV